ncbi:MAG: NAD-glutamate dehydrogenase [Pseudomonadota bacterium]
MSADTYGASLPREQLFSQFDREADNEDLRGLSADALRALAGSLWARVDAAEHGQTEVHIAASTKRDATLPVRTLIEIIGPDMPFLVDSMLNTCAMLGHNVLALFHPVVTLQDDTHLSAIQVHLPLIADDEAKPLVDAIHATLSDVDQTVSDHDAMRAAMRQEIAKLSRQDHLPALMRNEAIEFLRWLENEHFVFLGKRTYTFPRDDDAEILPVEPEMVEGSNLGLLRKEDLNVLNRSSEPTVLTEASGEFVAQLDPIIIAKSTMQSCVHRHVPSDYVGIKHYDGAGKVCGETRFLGLFTAEAYDETARTIPMIRRRVSDIIEASGASAGGHSEKALANLIETWPRDELLQTDAETLSPMLVGALHLIGRPRIRLFLRFDEFDRFVTAIVYVPREAYDTTLRMKIADLLADQFNGVVKDFQPRFDTSPLARVTYHIRLDEGHPNPDVDRLEKQIAALSRTWDQAFREALAESDLAGEAAKGAPAFRGAFNAAYREAFTPSEALIDVSEMAHLSAEHPLRIRGYRLPDDDPALVRAKIYSRSGSIALSRCVPVVENMGLFVEFETGYPVRPETPPTDNAPETYWVHNLKMKRLSGKPVDFGALAEIFQDAFLAVWTGRAENDGFNRLVFSAEASWQECVLLRALCAYRKQTGRDPARPTQIQALANHSDLTRQVLALFKAKFDPDASDKDLETRSKRCDALRQDIEIGLESVPALDDDRVIRRLADLILASVRTNYYQDGAEALSLKIASREVEELPAPKPYREIFVASPEVEGVHCRFGPVARGGLRWSDRRDDFRTEVLGLVKAQQVKNAVIVPVGSKGGFFPKWLPEDGGREDVRQAGISAYRSFISSLLCLTDNLVDGKVVHPDRTVVWDGEDPYLVVAADKGTATFSDIANEISQSQGFWLGDAFASGGSAGYDHKKMGITARGGWEAVKRHFREIGKDIQTETFSVIGVGDMSGDVFGNGMLLSKQINLIAAFNHMHIFIDPDPADPERLWDERKRLFDLPRSSWADYDESLISEGGGIFERSAKAISLTPQIKTLTGLGADRVTPNELIHALLKVQAELLWFGGIGTYVKASTESHTDAGDRTNDGLRIDARQLNVDVVGEGANLGMTQAARIEAALAGARLNTDAIDNSAGVDSSDHEVNIKILASEAIRTGALPSGERNELLRAMTNDVASHVLQHNYAQTGVLTLAEAASSDDTSALDRRMDALETRGVLDRDLEGLPDSGDLQKRFEADKPLTRPELSVILAWTKITLFDDLVESSVPDDPAFEEMLESYFPAAIRKYPDAIEGHRLRREIVATMLANRMLDAIGPAGFQRLQEATGADNAALTAAFEVAARLLNISQFQAEVNALDNTVAAHVQTQMHASTAQALAMATQWLVLQQDAESVAALVARFQAPVDMFKASLRDTASSHVGVRIERQVRTLMSEGVPEPLARWSAAMTYFVLGIQLVPLALEHGDMTAVAATYFSVGENLRLDRLLSRAGTHLKELGYWDRLATRRMMDTLRDEQISMVREALDDGGVDPWLESRASQRKMLMDQLRSFSEGHVWSFSKFALAGDALRAFRTKDV